MVVAAVPHCRSGLSGSHSRHGYLPSHSRFPRAAAGRVASSAAGPIYPGSHLPLLGTFATPVRRIAREMFGVHGLTVRLMGYLTCWLQTLQARLLLSYCLTDRFLVQKGASTFGLGLSACSLHRTLGRCVNCVNETPVESLMLMLVLFVGSSSASARPKRVHSVFCREAVSHDPKVRMYKYDFAYVFGVCCTLQFEASGRGES